METSFGIDHLLSCGAVDSEHLHRVQTELRKSIVCFSNLLCNCESLCTYVSVIKQSVVVSHRSIQEHGEMKIEQRIDEVC